ncbi:MAG TPA: S-layer homology domain-containing protein, partial [Candidatus Limnocylindria bacterium]|nr:S-layer homology domain-containing protein [Candidatus Limnocylindria bacterium]
MPPTRRTVAALALGLALAAFPLGALASHQFGDVPDSNIYHADIDALADSGVTTGCGGGNFCPSAFVTREQMAAFMNRLGALAAGKTPV